MNPCDQILWIIASLLALAIVAYRRQECFARRRCEDTEERYVEGTYFGRVSARRRRPIPHRAADRTLVRQRHAPEGKGRPRSHEMPRQALS
jgi:hypothetical protein